MSSAEFLRPSEDTRIDPVLTEDERFPNSLCTPFCPVIENAGDEEKAEIYNRSHNCPGAKQIGTTCGKNPIYFCEEFGKPSIYYEDSEPANEMIDDSLA